MILIIATTITTINAMILSRKKLGGREGMKNVFTY